MRSWWLSRGALVVMAALLSMMPVAARGADYLIGAEDILQVSVWMHPELERTVTVDSDGNIVLPPLGEIKAAGLTPKQLGDRLGDRLSTYLRQTATVTVTVTQFLSRSVQISGAVAKPGRYGFERMPGLIDLIQHAGGGLPNADMSRVQVLRREGGSLRTTIVDVGQAIQEGTEVKLPPLEVGDVIVVPTSAAGMGVSQDAAGILGEVQRPGLYPVGEGQDLWILLAQAGGPTPRAKLSSIKIVTKEGSASSAVTVDLDETLTKGNRAPYIVKPGAIVFLISKGSAWSAFTQMLGFTRDVIGLVAITQALQK
jgi:polysaccharide export outer membrane protein